MSKRAVHALESSTEDDARGGTYEYMWLACRDPERWNEGYEKPLRHVHTRDWNKVTCKLCLKRKEQP